jgi:hypothetical protein
MPEADVLVLLGRPDDVSTQKDWNFRLANALEIWRYGASGHMRPATLGQLSINRNHRVQYASGGGIAPPDGMFDELQLRQILEALDELPAVDELGYNPRPVIRAVNLLQPLGKQKALAAIDEFLRVSFWFTARGSQEGLFLVLRTLFEVPTEKTAFPHDRVESPHGCMPPMLIGVANLDEPTDMKLLPRYPIVIEDDIPFLICTRIAGGGMPQHPASHVAYFRKYGTLRKKPLAPTTKPFDAVGAVAKFRRWYFQSKSDEFLTYKEEDLRTLLGNQALRLLDTVRPYDSDEEGFHLSQACECERKKADDEANRKIVEEASKLAIRWDSHDSKYTFLDGTSLTPPDPNRYQCELWKPVVPGLEIEFNIKRDSRSYLGLGLEQVYEIGKPGPRANVRVLNPKARNQTLCEFKLGEPPHDPGAEPLGVPPGTRGSRETGMRIRLAEGNEIQLELTVGKQVLRSPVFRP